MVRPRNSPARARRVTRELELDISSTYLPTYLLETSKPPPKIRAQHGTGTAHFLDGPSIKPSTHIWAQHRDRQYQYPVLFSIRPLMLSPARAQQPHVRPRKNSARARRGARVLELNICTTY